MDSMDLWVESDRKHLEILPVLRIRGVGRMGNSFRKYRPPYEPSEIGRGIRECFAFIKDFGGGDEERILRTEKRIPWTKRGSVRMEKQPDGSLELLSEYVDHEIMTVELIERYRAPADASDEEIGGLVLKGLEQSFDYALRKEFAVYYAENEGLLFVPMLLSRTGYAMGGYCRQVGPPYAPSEVRAAVDEILRYIAGHPKDTRTVKERRAQLPWRAYSKYKSMHGFVKSHHSIETHVLTDGSFVFLPTLRSDSYDSEYVVYESLKNILDRDISDQAVVDEIFGALKISRLIYEKRRECRGQDFWEYIRALGAERRNRL